MEPSTVCGRHSPFLLQHQYLPPSTPAVDSGGLEDSSEPCYYSSTACSPGPGPDPKPACHLFSLSVTRHHVHTYYTQVLMAHGRCLFQLQGPMPHPSASGRHLFIPCHFREGHLGLSQAILGTPILPAHTVAHCHVDGDFRLHACYPRRS